MSQEDALVDRHLRAGYVGLAVYVALGIALEVLHAIKAPMLVDAGRETTRLLLRLGHAHGTLLSLINIAYALTVTIRPKLTTAKSVSPALLSSLVLVPVGFTLGALWARGGDPGIGVALVPVGAVALMFALVVLSRRLGRRDL